MICKNNHRFFVAELETGYVILGDRQYFKGYTVFLCKKHITELHLLEKNFRKKFLLELSFISESVYKSFRPHKLNYEILGNVYPHLHCHISPRYKDDPGVKDPVWFKVSELAKSDKHIPGKDELQYLKISLLTELEKIKGIHIIDKFEF